MELQFNLRHNFLISPCDQAYTQLIQSSTVFAKILGLIITRFKTIFSRINIFIEYIRSENMLGFPWQFFQVNRFENTQI